MSTYDKSVSISREEEGTYHRREYETSPRTKSKPITSLSTQSYEVAKNSDSSDEDNYEEWTTSKRKINHKTRQVETRVSRQLLVEDGKVIADSGPQVVTRIKEDNKVEECEKEKTPKNKSKFDAIENATETGESTGRVLGEKKGIQRISREIREENMQYHDERFKELTGHDVHRRAIQAPHELITITDRDANAPPRGKMVHYSNKGKKYQDTDEVLEVAKLAIDGSITKEVKRTKHHEEFSEDEKPDETGEAEELRLAPKVERSSRRHVDYVNDFDDTSTPITSSDDEQETSATRKHNQKVSGSSKLGGRRTHKSKSGDDEAFPRYQIDPLLNSLNDDDYKPATRTPTSDRYSPASGRSVDHPIQRRIKSESSSDEEESRYRHHSARGYPQRQQTSAMRSVSPSQAVEIPEEYRVRHKSSSGMKQKNSSVLSGSSGHQRQRERSYSPNSKMSHRSSKSHAREDASVQAHLTDEEIERKSMSSSVSGGLKTHEKTTRKLERQATLGGSKRNYYYGNDNKQRAPSVHSETSSSSLSDPKEQMRRHGVRSRDSGFRSPHSHARPMTPTSAADQQQIYSVSNKQKRNNTSRSGAISPTPTTGSLGQRSVKTTTTTVSAGLAERPIRTERTKVKSRQTQAKEAKLSDSNSSIRIIPTVYTDHYISDEPTFVRSRHYNKRQREARFEDNSAIQSIDNISLSSLGPNATTIKVPYKRIVDPDEYKTSAITTNRNLKNLPANLDSRSELESELSLQSDIHNLSKRLETIKNREPIYFDYKTLEASIAPANNHLPGRPQVVDAYNVKVIMHNSPFKKISQEQSEQYDHSKSTSALPMVKQPNEQTSNSTDNNNEVNFNLQEFIKTQQSYAEPMDLDEFDRQLTKLKKSEVNDGDEVSLVSSCSLRSTRTYDIRTTTETESSQSPLAEPQIEVDVESSYIPDDNNIELEDENDRCRGKAWIFDLRDGSSTAISHPPRPKECQTVSVDSKVEPLAESRGGRSYFIELIEKEAPNVERQKEESIELLNSRSVSQGNLVAGDKNRQKSPIIRSNTIRSTQDKRGNTRKLGPATSMYSKGTCILSGSNNCNLDNQNQDQELEDISKRRQLGFGGSFASRSKSSSCLLTPNSIKPTKYSIYGGLKKTDGNHKTVPRLSYSRTIGPKSQRQIDAQAKTPSRYLKVK